jgi:hypothetical protein
MTRMHLVFVWIIASKSIGVDIDLFIYFKKYKKNNNENTFEI